MRTTIDFLDMLKSKYSLRSDYAIAKFLACGQSRICNYRKGRSFLCDSEAILLASALEIDPGYVLLCVHYERARNDADKAVWRSVVATYETVQNGCRGRSPHSRTRASDARDGVRS